MLNRELEEATRVPPNFAKRNLHGKDKGSKIIDMG